MKKDRKYWQERAEKAEKYLEYLASYVESEDGQFYFPDGNIIQTKQARDWRSLVEEIIARVNENCSKEFAEQIIAIANSKLFENRSIEATKTFYCDEFSLDHNGNMIVKLKDTSGTVISSVVNSQGWTFAANSPCSGSFSDSG
jgi:hypothetical protein